MATDWREASFHGNFTNLKSFVQYTVAADWTITATQAQFQWGGGITSFYYFNVQGISCELGWWEDGSYYPVNTASVTYNKSGGDEWAFSMSSDYFTRTASDRTVYLYMEGYFAEGGTAYAESPAFTVPHLAGKPTSLTATRNSDTSITLSWTNPSTSYDYVYIEVSANGGAYSEVTHVSTRTSYTWTGASADKKYTFRIRTYYKGSYSDYSNTATVYTTPTAPTWTSVTRNSDTQVTLKWSNTSASYTKVYIERQTDGGSWSALANVSKGTTQYVDSTTTKDHAYKYRIRSYNGGRYSSYATSGTTITMTPAAPTKITLSRSSGTTVDVTLTNNSNVATKVQYQVSTDGGATWGTTTDSASLTSFSVTISGTGKVRARNYNSTGTSDWITSASITTLTPPNPPTLKSPSGIVNKSLGGNVTFSWTHNPVDGSAQTAYKLDYSIDGGSTWTELTGTTSQTRNVAVSTWSAGATVTWRVCTKGADASYSDWSSTKTFNVYTEPSVSITSPSGSITSMPISVSATYSDMTGFSCAAATVAIYSGTKKLYSKSCTISGTSITASITAGNYLPENGESYTAKVTVRSSSSLTSSAESAFSTDFTEPAEGSLDITNDPETGCVQVSATYDNTGADEPAVAVSIARVNADGTTTMLLDHGANADTIIDKYAPLNTPYQYTVITHASSEAITTVDFDNIIETDLWFVYWGDNIASAKWNPDNAGINVARPQKKRVWYVGRKDPVSYDGSAVSFTESPSWMILTKEEAEPFIQLIEDGGRGIYKSCDGMVYRADFDLTLSPNYTAIGYYGGVQLNITRIAGEQL